MPQPAISLPMHAIEKLRPETLDLARRIDGIIGHLADEQGFGTIVIQVKRGVAKTLEVTRSFKLDDEIA